MAAAARGVSVRGRAAGAAAAPARGAAGAARALPSTQKGAAWGPQVVQAKEWPDKEYIAECDVRSAPEHDEEHPTLSVNIPIINAKRRFNSETKQREYIQTVNEDFIAQVEKKFPDKETKLIIGCSDGRLRSINALEALDEAGYTNIVGAKGGGQWLHDPVRQQVAPQEGRRLHRGLRARRRRLRHPRDGRRLPDERQHRAPRPVRPHRVAGLLGGGRGRGGVGAAERTWGKG